MPISDLISLEQLNNSLSKVMISTKNLMIWLSDNFNAPNQIGKPYQSSQNFLI